MLDSKALYAATEAVYAISGGFQSNVIARDRATAAVNAYLVAVCNSTDETLRDKFAMAAPLVMQSNGYNATPEAIATRAYAIADAMLKRRKD